MNIMIFSSHNKRQGGIFLWRKEQRKMIRSKRTKRDLMLVSRTPSSQQNLVVQRLIRHIRKKRKNLEINFKIPLAHVKRCEGKNKWLPLYEKGEPFL